MTPTACFADGRCLESPQYRPDIPAADAARPVNEAPKVWTHEEVRKDPSAALVEIERLQALVPTGDYVLVDDMEVIRTPKHGHGLFCTEDQIKSVS